MSRSSRPANAFLFVIPIKGLALIHARITMKRSYKAFLKALFVSNIKDTWPCNQAVHRHHSRFQRSETGLRTVHGWASENAYCLPRLRKHCSTTLPQVPLFWLRIVLWFKHELHGFLLPVITAAEAPLPFQRFDHPDPCRMPATLEIRS